MQIIEIMVGHHDPDEGQVNNGGLADGLGDFAR
jgi:hypothetical protein